MNKAILIGHLGYDPTTRFTASGDAVCRMRLATNRYYKDKSGERQERTEWHTVIMFKGLAETAQKILKRGMQIAVEGEIRYREYTKNLEKHEVAEVVADDFQILDKKPKPERTPTDDTEAA